MATAAVVTTGLTLSLRLWHSVFTQHTNRHSLRPILYRLECVCVFSECSKQAAAAFESGAIINFGVYLQVGRGAQFCRQAVHIHRQ